MGPFGAFKTILPYRTQNMALFSSGRHQMELFFSLKILQMMLFCPIKTHSPVLVVEKTLFQSDPSPSHYPTHPSQFYGYSLCVCVYVCVC